MRLNEPVTQREYRFEHTERLISATDKHGRITHCNDAFQRVSGYEREDLIGQPHNLIRHPDMPSPVFKEMWDTLKAGKIWMGLVKNRRADGDHYWVSAFVTPVHENGSLIGYESVRVTATEDEKKRATEIYAKLRAGKPPVSFGQKCMNFMKSYLPFLLIGGTVLGIDVFFGEFLVGLMAFGAVILAGTFANIKREKEWQEIIAQSPESYSNELVAQTYFPDTGKKARAKLVLLCELSRCRIALARISDAAQELDNIADSTQIQAEVTSSAAVQQNQSTQQIASAITQMSAAIQEVAERVESNAQNSKQAYQNVNSGNDRAKEALHTINLLNDAVESITSTVGELAESTGQIGQAANIISTIAEQTNLLALNAAIEAARAGEQGRGVSVVADEVRSLALKTHESTDHIHQIIHTLTSRSERAVSVSRDGKASAEQGVAIVEKTRDALAEINQAVSTISNMTIEMSSSVEEQSNVAEHINEQIVGIADGAMETKSASEKALEASKTLKETITMVNSVIDRFQTTDKKSIN
jgi:aerotaxis receptor